MTPIIASVPFPDDNKCTLYTLKITRHKDLDCHLCCSGWKRVIFKVNKDDFNARPSLYYIFTFAAKGGEGIRENPLARLLRPDGRDEKEKEQLRLPNRVQSFWIYTTCLKIEIKVFSILLHPRKLKIRLLFSWEFDKSM
jgi:hypothetical protein